MQILLKQYSVYCSVFFLSRKGLNQHKKHPFLHKLIRTRSCSTSEESHRTLGTVMLFFFVIQMQAEGQH